MDEGVFNKIFSAATGVWALVCMALVAAFKVGPGIMGRLNERQRDIADARERDVDLIRHERDIAREERDGVRDRLAERDQRIANLLNEMAVLLGRAVKAEATLEGLGEARQEAQRIVSAERQKDAGRKGNGGEA